MAEVKKNNKSKAKKASKVLDEKTTLSNDELLEQIISKKKNKPKTSSSTKQSSTSGKSTVNKVKRVTKKKENEISSDDIYEQIKSKKSTKKKSSIKKESSISTISDEQNINVLDEDKKIDFENVVLEPRKEEPVTFSKAIKEIKEENDDLIITREIRFDDLSSNLKDKKTLEELKNAIEEYDRLDGDKSANDLNDDIELLPSIKYSNYKLKRNALIIGSIIMLIIILFGICFVINNITHSIHNEELFENEQAKLLEAQRKLEEEKRQKEILYNDCLNRTVSDSDMTEKVLNAQSDLVNYVKDKYSVSISYEDLTYGYSFNYNQDKVYYAASTIKSLAALYIYTEAAKGNINLDDTITYLSKYKFSYSAGVSKYKIGSKIKIRELVKFSVIYSDNSAHQMLVSYIGRNKLKEFGRSLGAKNTLAGGDNFGNISSSDGLIYMKAVNNFIENNAELGLELKGYFVNSQQNEISVNNLEVAHKYGLYKAYYHNIGVVYDDSPYVVSIMTLHGKKNKESVIKDISGKIYELHTLYKVNREEVCKIEVYGNEKSTSS